MFEWGWNSFPSSSLFLLTTKWSRPCTLQSGIPLKMWGIGRFQPPSKSLWQSPSHQKILMGILRARMNQTWSKVNKVNRKTSIYCMQKVTFLVPTRKSGINGPPWSCASAVYEFRSKDRNAACETSDKTPGMCRKPKIGSHSVFKNRNHPKIWRSVQTVFRQKLRAIRNSY